MSPVFDAPSRSRDRNRKHGAVLKRRPSDCRGGRPCKRRKRSALFPDDAAELFPVPVVTSSSPTAVTCQPRASSPSSLMGVGRLLLLLPTMWLPWLLPITSLCLASALPVDSDASRSPVKVFDGSANNAGVDGPMYLMQFGYLPASDLETGALRTEEELRRAIRHFQRLANVRQTGRFDAETVAAMKRPRCGMADLLTVGHWTAPTAHRDRTHRHRHGHGSSDRHGSRHGPAQEYAFGPSKWHKTTLTYRILNFTPDLNAYDTRHAIFRGFSVWSDVSTLEFHEVQTGPADILIEFASGYHHDGYPFDGEGLVLAHAFFPGEDRGGDIHFDDDEPWTDDTDAGVNLFLVAAHEIGHALGLAHSSDPESLMYPWHKGYERDFTLPYDDTVAIQQLYGVNPNLPDKPFAPRTERPTTTTTTTTVRPVVAETTPRRSWVTVSYNPRPHAPSNPCKTNFDAISIIRGEVFAFKGKWFWRITEAGVMEGHPVETRRFWFGLPPELDHVDAVYERVGDGQIIFFSGARYWELTGTERYPVAGRPLTDAGLPSDVERVDAAFVWGHNRRAYVISDSMYWKLVADPGRTIVESHTYPRDMSMWAGVPIPVDGALTYTNGRTYFFKDNDYWEFSNVHMHVRRGYPRHIGTRWLNCSTILSADNDLNADRQGASGAVPSDFRLSTAAMFVCLMLAEFARTIGSPFE